MNEPHPAAAPVRELPCAIPIPVQLLCLDEVHTKYAYLFDLQAEHGGIPVPVTGTVLRDCYNLRSAYFKEGEVLPTTPTSDLAKFMKDLYAATIQHPLSTTTKVATNTYPPAEALADLEVRLSVLAKLVRTRDQTVSRTLSALSGGIDKLVHTADSLATRIARLEAKVEAGVGGRPASTCTTGPCGTKNPHLHSAYCAHTVHPVSLKTDQAVNTDLPSAGHYCPKADLCPAGAEPVTPTSVSELKRQWEDIVLNCSTLGNASPSQFASHACPAFPTVPVPAPDGRSDVTSTFNVRDYLPSLDELNAAAAAPWSGDMHQCGLPANFTAAPCCTPFNPIVVEKLLAAPTLPGRNRAFPPLPKVFECIDDLYTYIHNLEGRILMRFMKNEAKEKATNDKVNKLESQVLGDFGHTTGSPWASTLHDTMRDVVTRLVVLEVQKRDSEAKIEALTQKLDNAMSHHLALEGLAKAVITNEIAIEEATTKVTALADPKFEALANLPELVNAQARKLDAVELSLLEAQSELANLSNMHNTGGETRDRFINAHLDHLEEQIAALKTATAGPSTSDLESRLNELAQKFDSLSTLVTQNAKIRDRLSSQHVESLEGIRESLGKCTNLTSELDIKRDISVATRTKPLAKAEETLDRGVRVNVKGKKKADAEEQNTQHTSVATLPPAQVAQSTSIVPPQPIQAAPALPAASTAAQSNSNATPEVGPSLSGPLDMDGLVLSWRRNAQQQQEQRKTSKAKFKSPHGDLTPVYSHPSTQGTSTRPGATMSPNIEVRPPSLPKIPGSFPSASALNAP